MRANILSRRYDGLRGFEFTSYIPNQ